MSDNNDLGHISLYNIDGKTFLVRYTKRDDFHVYTSPELPGLYIASKDAMVARLDVGIAIKKIMKLGKV